jgi:hypothetical protein
MVHEIRIDTSPDPLPRGPSLFLPFEGSNARIENGQGKADFKLALDLPPMKTIHHARIYMMNNRALATRIIEYREFGESEVKSNPEFMRYLGLHRGAL